MRPRLRGAALILLALLTTARTASLLAQETAFTYQGQLLNNGSPANGIYSLTFALFATNTGGASVAAPFTNAAVFVTNGLFEVQMDFGSNIWNGQTRWLEIGVAPNGNNPFTILAPRQAITPAPYAVFANTTSNLLGGLPATQLTGAISLAQLPAAVLTTNESTVTLSGNLRLPSTSVRSDLIYSGSTVLLDADAMDNFFVGLNAGSSNTSGYDNTATGTSALFSNTTGSENTANGTQALYSNTAGSGNTAMGSTALSFNTIGSDNTGSGVGALYSNTNGSLNTANGVQSLFLNTTGSGNTASGAGALFSNVAGSGNTATGAEALAANTNSSGNTAVGYQALANTSSGSNNIALGYQAGFNITNGNSNIDIGNAGVPDDANIIRIGSGQIQTFVAGVITGNGAGLNSLQGTNIALGSIGNGQLASSSITVNAGAGLSGGGTVALGGSITLSATGNSGGIISVTGNGDITAVTAGGAVTLGDTATNADLPNTIVKRDTNGGFSAGPISAVNFSGNGAGLTNLSAGSLTGLLPVGFVGNSQLANSFINVNAGSGLGGGGSVSLGNSITLNNAGVTSLSSGGGVTVSASTGGVILGSTATSASTAYAIVSRDGTGSFFAQNITANGSFSGSGGNLTGLNASQLSSGTVGSAVFGGNYGNAVIFNNPTNSFFGNGAGLTGVTAVSAGSANTAAALSTGAALGAGSSNLISSSGSTDCFIGGGQANQVQSSSQNSFIGGGSNNLVGSSSQFSTVPGGQNNMIQGGAGWSFIGGGVGNTTSSGWSYIGGGQNNTVGGGTEASTIAGGQLNTNNGSWSAIPGGFKNQTSASYTFAAGELAQAEHQGAFVWSDGSGTATTSTNNNSVTMRASGGYRLMSSDANTTNGVYLAPGSGSWSSLSDRNAKDDLAAVNPGAILAGVAALPISKWSYKTQQGIEHLGPMAQDFHAAFNVGENDTSISTVDEEGVALAAIQGLNRKLEQQIKERDARIQMLDQRLERLENLMSHEYHRSSQADFGEPPR